MFGIHGYKIKLINHSLSTYSAYGISIDFSFSKRIKDNYTFGFNFSDLISYVKWDDGMEYKIYPKISIMNIF